MRLLQLLTAALLPFITLAAKKSTGDRFKDYHGKQLSNGAPIKLDDTSYQQLTKTPRDYAAAILLTAMDARFGCQLCNDFQPEWDLLGKSWSRGDWEGESRLIFGTLDFMDGKSTFQSVRNTINVMETLNCTLILHSWRSKPLQSYYSSIQLLAPMRSLMEHPSASISSLRKYRPANYSDFHLSS